MGLSAERLAAVKAVIDSLPLCSIMRARALDSLEQYTDEDADRIIALHKKLVESLPAALAAVNRIRGLS